MKTDAFDLMIGFAGLLGRVWLATRIWWWSRPPVSIDELEAWRRSYRIAKVMKP